MSHAKPGTGEDEVVDDALDRLRSPEALDQLAALSVDVLAQQPVSELVDPDWLAGALVRGLRSTSEAEGFEAWVGEHLRALGAAGARAANTGGSVGEHVPITLLPPLEALVGRPTQPHLALARATIDHPSFRLLVRELLRDQLVAFAGRLRAALPGSGKGRKSRLAGLAGVALDVAGAVGGQVERQLETRVEGFLDDTMSATVQRVLERACSPGFAPELANWRVEALRALLNQPVRSFGEQIEELLPEEESAELASDLADVLRALASHRDLQEELQRLIASLLAAGPSGSVQDWLEGSGLEEAWRAEAQELLRRQLVQVAQSPLFEAWWQHFNPRQAEG